MSITTTDPLRIDAPRRRRVRRAAVTGEFVRLVLRGLIGRSRHAAHRASERRRGAVLVALVAAVLVGTIGVGSTRGTASQPATQAATEGHPLVGSWIVDPEVDNPTNPPSFDAFMDDGTLVNIGSDGASVGTWEATGPRTATFTFAGLVQEAGSGAAFIIRANIEVDETGERFSGTHSFTLVAADGTILAAAQGGGAHGTRFHAEPMEAGGQTLPGFPTWTPATPPATPPEFVTTGEANRDDGPGTFPGPSRCRRDD